MPNRFAAAVAVFFALTFSFAGMAAPESGASVVVVYNSNLLESKQTAEHYAKKRSVPEGQIVGLDLPGSETISRDDFRADLQKPLFRFLENKKLFTVRSESVTAKDGSGSKVFWQVKESKIRYLVLCYGVPSRVIEEPGINEPNMDKMPKPLQRNGAAVDSELMMLPLLDFKLPITGTLPNPFFGTTNLSSIHPTNGVVMVARLDGPTGEIARGLVDKALQAETNGLWGRAYFDLRGLTEGEYKMGEELLGRGTNVTRQFGFETIVDKKEETWPAAYPMSQIAVYAGWYNEHVSGPFAQNTVEFMPGAIAYHLHSFSASTLRAVDKHWAGPLVAKGATVTIGFVDEPYLSMTIDVGMFLDRLFSGSTFGEAACVAQLACSWQTTIIGDPLYCPFTKSPQEQHRELEASRSPMLEWSHLRIVNFNFNMNTPAAEAISYIEDVGKESPVLAEKLGDIYLSQGKTWQAINAYAQALNLKPSPQQEIRLMLTLGENFESVKQFSQALDIYQLLLKRFPKYPDREGVQKKVSDLGKK